MNNFRGWLPAAALMMLTLCGCIEPRITNTSRSAVEQLLLATVIERGVNRMDFSGFAGKSALMDYRYLAPQSDKEYIQAVLETHLAASGVAVIESAENADLLVRPYCGTLATTSTSFNIGTPSLPIPLPYTDLTFAIPELSLVKRISRSAYSRLSVVVFDRSSMKLLYSQRGINDRSIYNNWTFFFFLPFVSRDVEVGQPEKSSWYFFDR